MTNGNTDSRGRTIFHSHSHGGRRYRIVAVDQAVYPTAATGYIAAWCLCEDCDGSGERVYDAAPSRYDGSDGYGAQLSECSSCSSGETIREFGTDGEDVTSLYDALRQQGLISREMHVSAVKEARQQAMDMGVKFGGVAA